MIKDFFKIFFLKYESDSKADDFIKDLCKNHEFEKREDGIYMALFKMKEDGPLIYPEVCTLNKNKIAKPLTMLKMYFKYRRFQAKK